MSAAITLLVALVAVPALASHSWGGYHWARSSNPFTVQLGDNVDSGWDAYLATTSSVWSQSSVLDTVVATGGTSARRCRATTGRVEVCNSTYGNNGWLGLAQIWLSGSHITKGVVKVNDTYFSLPAYNNPAERNHVMCQEVGHTLGLGHTSEDGSSQETCMDYSNDPNSQHPNQHDYDQLAAIYSHSDTEGGGTPPPTCKNPRKCNNLPAAVPPFAQASPEKGRVYTDDLGNGNRLVTFVYWEADAHGKR